MFTKKITLSDDFLSMPHSTQNLYFHLNMEADDEGFVNSVKRIMRMVNVNEDDMKILIAKRFVLVFETGVIVIKHWKLHNRIRKDRLKETSHTYEKSMLIEREGGIYTEAVNQLTTKGQPDDNQMSTNCPPSIGKVSIVESSKDNVLQEIKTVIDYLNETTNSQYKTTTKKTHELIKARFKEGFTVDDFKTVIDKKTNEWTNTEMAKFLRPITLFGTKFESYLNQAEVTTTKKNVVIDTPEYMQKKGGLKNYEKVD